MSEEALVTECERFCSEVLGGSASRSGIACHADDDGMVDTMITQPSRFCGTGGLDVTVVNTLAPSHCTTAAGADASHPLRAAEEENCAGTPTNPVAPDTTTSPPYLPP